VTCLIAVASSVPAPGFIPIHRGTVIHQDDACVAPTIGAIIGGPRRGEACLALVPSCIPVRGMASSVSAPGFIPIYRGAVIHQGDACVAPTIGAIIDGPRRGEACLALVPSFIPVRGMASFVPAPGFIPIHRGAVIHQGDACVAPTIGAIIAGPRRGEACLALVPSSIPVRGMASSVSVPGVFPFTGVP
jgi:hypothetical protein